MSGGPRVLLLVRHGESVGNVAAREAERAGAEELELATRDADTPLSELGRAQADAIGPWLAALPVEERPRAVWCSPYVRAVETTERALAAAGLDLPVERDERLRDRELGVLDRLTVRGVQERFPLEAELRARLGKFYHRPAGGESWADVALRLRSLVRDVEAAPDAPLMVVAHDAVIVLLRYVLEHLTEREVLDLSRRSGVRNASVTTMRRDDDQWSTPSFAAVDHLAVLDEPTGDHAATARGGRADDAGAVGAGAVGAEERARG
ncbi:phosphoglycerate mutase family protein [Cellulomonas sp. DKR-3]|uniref:phosphoglycerate mutase (2,3-diphosphoglycerate-dependent) n=1 Tax=Cellulomonas fulva TaxID=2835530 RepID=A0ABS5U0S2_9CELL|nr:histidine phosphatase family protein [Cellulomonas fulva]MBT0994987.1 phosphoglycerate mutase family protein [Cellulomonas fulva]